ncbi:MAG: hypothetical protein GF405_10975 [Candidatus Eisenbacteria bacterium]|nr:hypothetical protein [Candidatus Eisenbacteria bacterium]
MRIFANQESAWIFLVLMALAPVAAVWFYRRVPPTVGRGLRVGLATLRAAALILLFAALIEPVVALTSVGSERPVVAVLIDESRSMSVPDGTGGVERGSEAVELVSEVLLERIARDAEVAAFAFSGDVRPLDEGSSGVEEVSRFDGDATDLENAIEEVARGPGRGGLGAVIVATDGAVNRGGSPVDAGARLDAPVFVLGVGSPEPPVDITVEEVLTNRISYAGETLPVVARITSAGFGGSETSVEIVEDGDVIESQVVSLSGTGEEAEVTFRVRPREPGTHRYTVRVPEAPGETVTGNNERVVLTTTLKGRFRVLLAASRPAWDFAFVRRELKADRNVELTAVVGDGSGVPASREELLEYDLVLLVDPDWDDPAVPEDWLRAFVVERGGGLAVFGLPEGTPGALPSFLPVESVERVAAPREERVTLTPDGESSPILRVENGRSENVLAWTGLPPVWTAPAGTFRAAPEGVVLAEAGDGPVIVLGGGPSGGQTLAVLAEGIWRWKMAGESEDLLSTFVSNAARWLTARGEVERVAVTTDADVVPVGGLIRFRGQVYRADLSPEMGATLSLEVVRGGGAPLAEVSMTPVVGGYEGELSAPPPGAYTYRATASIDGEVVGTDEGTFEVEPFALEDADVRRRSSVLRRLAEVTGGAYVTPETLDDLPAELPLERVVRRRSKEYELWDTPWLLTAFVGLLSIEWALRRRKGMP